MGMPVRKQRRTTSAKVDPTKPATIIINQKFNGLTHFCGLTGYVRSTVHGWLNIGYIPPVHKRQPTHLHILEVAKANRIKLLPSDFVEVPHVASATGDAGV